MKIKSLISKISMLLLLVAALVVPKVSLADWSIGIGVGDHHDHSFYRYHDHPHYGLHLHYLPDGYFTVWVSGVRYYYYDGLYYSYVGDGDYVLVSPPAGAIVTAIPSDFQPVVTNGVTYYVNDGVYYLYTPHGYQVIQQPMVVAQPAVVMPSSAPVPAQDTFPVNIPNNNGGYSTVIIKKSGNGYSGPQGEFYAEFPKVAQLKAMYGK
jgi:hypothetical protein